MATVISTIAGTFAAIGLFNIRRRWREPLNTVGNIPMMNADIVTGVSLCLLFVAFIGGWNTFAQWVEGFRFTFLGSTFRVLMPRLEMGFWTLLLAHIVFDIPHIILTVTPKLRQMDKNLVDAYAKEGYQTIRTQPVERAVKRAEGTAERGHHSVFQHCMVTMEIQCPKIIAMLLNSIGVSNTSEKSARYTKMQPQTEKEREFYEKWHTLVLERICEVYPGKFDEKEVDKLGPP